MRCIQNNYVYMCIKDHLGIRYMCYEVYPEYNYVYMCIKYHMGIRYVLYMRCIQMITMCVCV